MDSCPGSSSCQGGEGQRDPWQGEPRRSRVGGRGGGELSLLCHFLFLCFEMLFFGFSLSLCVSLSLCLPDSISLLPLCPSLPFFLLLLLLPSSSSPPQPSLMHIIEFSLDHGCPFLQLILPTLVLPPTEVLPFCSKPGIPEAVSHLLLSPS